MITSCWSDCAAPVTGERFRVKVDLPVAMSDQEVARHIIK